MSVISPPREFSAAIGVHPVVARVLWQRGFQTIESARGFLDPDYYVPAESSELQDMDKAVARLWLARQSGELIRIWGDFDVDGQTSTSVLLLGLCAAQTRVGFTIPNRATHSHGLNEEGIRRAHAEGVTLLLTCDCGVTDFKQVALAQSLGLDVIITDHHDLGDHLPDTCAVINPKRLPVHHPLRTLPGVGVAYKLVQALLPDQLEFHKSLTDLVALGIVADLADQVADTRFLLQLGLDQLRTKPRPGVLALLQNAGVAPGKLDAETIGFQLGPRLNAAGRLDTAHVSVELLTTRDAMEAAPLAATIESLNQQRKTLQKSIEDEALRMLAEDPSLVDGPIVVLNAPHWQQSVLGIVAATIVNVTNKPAIVLTSPENELVRGSARSVHGVDIHGLIMTQGHLLAHSGGHPMAAGLALKREYLTAFREGIQRAALVPVPSVSRSPASADSEVMEALEDATEIPFVIQPQDATVELCDALDRLAPFGRGNPRPLLGVTDLRVVRIEKFGVGRRHVTFHLRDRAGTQLRAIMWRGVMPQTIVPEASVDLIFTLRKNEFKGRSEAQVVVVSIGLHHNKDSADQSSVSDPKPFATARFEVIDLRNHPDRDGEIARIVSPPNNHMIGRLGNWLDLSPVPSLLVTDAPPSGEEWRLALAAARPQTVVLAPVATGETTDYQKSFLIALEGMVKVARRRGDAVDDLQIQRRMAARVNHRLITIQAGLAMLQSLPSVDSEAATRLEQLLVETRAYRSYFRSAPATALTHVV